MCAGIKQSQTPEQIFLVGRLPSAEPQTGGGITQRREAAKESMCSNGSPLPFGGNRECSESKNQGRGGSPQPPKASGATAPFKINQKLARRRWGAEKEKPVNEGKPLGSGKSVLKSSLPEPLLGVYLNPDEMEALPGI